MWDSVIVSNTKFAISFKTCNFDSCMQFLIPVCNGIEIAIPLEHYNCNFDSLVYQESKLQFHLNFKGNFCVRHDY